MNISLSMPKQFAERLKKEGLTTGMTYSEIVRRALDMYFKETAKDKEAAHD